MRYVPRYFGCWGGAGHYVWTPQRSNDDRNHEWLRLLDGKLPPAGEQLEGLAKLYHFNGVTLLAFWDRSGDSRLGSNSVFALPGKLSFDQIVLQSRCLFPDVWQRFTFDVVLAVPEL